MKYLLTLILAVALLQLVGCRSPESGQTILITNVRLADGSGLPISEGALRILDDRILELGDLKPLAGEKVIDGAGKVLAPGFIDTHSHHDYGMFDKRDLPEVVSQGVTTIVIGQDGGSHFPISEFWQKLDTIPVAVNVASYTGHNTLREIAMENFAQKASPAEVEKMQGLLQAELSAGALGLSTGLEYDPGIYSSREEVMQLAAVLAGRGRRYISHMRSEDRFLWEALQEIIAIGRTHRIPVQISHLKIAMVSQWGKADSLLQMLNQARAEGIDITADVYPYEHWQSTMTVLFPERNFSDLEAARFALTELTTPHGMIISSYEADPMLVGKTLAQVAQGRNQDPEVVYLDLINTAIGQDADESIIAKSMAEDDVARFVTWPHSNLCSDGSLNDRHPRGAGSFPRALRQYVREQKQFSLEEAIRQFSALAAANMGFEDRGLLRPGYLADLVLLDPATITDKATFDDPGTLSEGIDRVWVNGTLVWDQGKTTKNFPGKAIKATN